MIVLGEGEKSYKVANTTFIDENNQEFFIVKDWNWYWDRDNLTYLSVDDVKCIIDDSGSDFRDGYELGLSHGEEKKESQFIAEGIIEGDPDDGDELNMSPRFDLYE